MDNCILLAANVIKELAITGAAITGAIVAVRGLSTWRAQLKGSAEYELSKRVLGKLYKHRDAIRRVRHIAMWAHEMPDPPEEKAKEMTHGQIRFYGRQKAYEKRWEKIEECRSSLYPDILESEVLWDNALTEIIQPLFQMENELLLTIQQQLEAENPNIRQEEKEHLNNSEDRDNRHKIIYRLSTRPDPFGEKYETQLQVVAEFLKAHLRK